MPHILKLEQAISNLYYLNDNDDAVAIGFDVYDRCYTVLVADPGQICLSVHIAPVISFNDGGNADKVYLDKVETRLISRLPGSGTLVLGSLRKLDASDLQSRLDQMKIDVEKSGGLAEKLLSNPTADVNLPFVDYDA